MEKPMSLQEFADRHSENYDIIKAVIDLYHKNIIYNLYTICAVCDKELTEEEKNAVEPSHFYRCCKEHAEYRSVCLIDPIREKLGYKKGNLLFIK
jgi:hypothetical protein